MNTYTQSPWSLAELFPSHAGPEMETALKSLDSQVADFETVRPHLTPEISTDDFLTIIQRQEKITRLAYRIYAFAGLGFTANTQDQTIQTFKSRVEQLMA